MRLSIFVLPFLLFCNTQFATAQTHKPYTIDRSEVLDIHSTANGQDYQLYIKLPSTYAQNPNKKYPLVLLNDGPYAFPLVSSVVLRMSEVHHEFEEPIIVGISFSKGDIFPISRTRDYTPTNVPPKAGDENVEAKKQSGQSAKYVQFLAQEVMPLLLKNYRVNETKKIFVGHSYGGLLGGYILVTQPTLFDYYLIGSPSFGYDKKVIFNMEAEYAKSHKDMPAKVLMITGGKETDMLPNMFAFEKALQSRHYPKLSISAKVLDHESHLSGFPSFVTDGLLWALPLHP